MIESDFRWATGVECSFIPHLSIDQYRWTQHDRFWRTDLELLRHDLGCQWLRYALPWHEIEKTPGVFDWRWFDVRLEHFEKLGINLLLDLAHFGTPTWLPDAFADADFPTALERFAAAFGERYSGRVRCVCPVNEPLITSLFCGDVGLWPPYGRGLQNYMTVLCRVAQGICRAVRALRARMPGVEILISDSLEVAVTYENSDETTSPFLKESLRADVERRMHRRHLVTDLILGRVDRHHPLLGWLQKHGFSDFDLHWFQNNAQTLDIIGLDYYEHTEVELYTTPEGYYRQRSLTPPLGLYRAAQDYWHKYHIPLMVTETSAGGNDAEKIAWLEKSVQDVRRLRAEGFPLLGYTWWPAIDHLDWDGAMLHQTGHIHPVGLYRLERRPNGTLERLPTALRDAYQALIRGGNDTAGPLIETSAQREGREARAAQISAGPTKLGWPVVVHGRIPWNDLWVRPQHVFSQVSKRHAVLYVDPPRFSEAEEYPRVGTSFHPVFPHLCTVSIQLPAALEQDPKATGQECRRLFAEVMAQTPRQEQFHQAVQWFCDAAAAPIYAAQFPASATVYEAVDQILDDALLGSADVVFTNTHEAQALAVSRQARSFLVPDGVEVKHFARVQSERVAVPNDINFVPRAILGYFGAVDDRLDYHLIRALAEANPLWSIVMVGPVVGVAPESLPRRNNIYWIGYRPYGEMPDYLFGFQVAIAPYLVNDANRRHSSIKLGEYVMGGRPVVCTDLPAARERFGDFVTVAGSTQEFIDGCHRALADSEHPRLEQGRRAFAKMPWRSVATFMEARIADVLAHRSGS